MEEEIESNTQKSIRQVKIVRRIFKIMFVLILITVGILAIFFTEEIESVHN